MIWTVRGGRETLPSARAVSSATAKQMQTTMLRAMEFYRRHTQNRVDKPKEREER